MDYQFLLDLAIILLFTKIFGVFSKQFKLPQVVGALVAGILLGPAVLNIIHESEFIMKISELGVIVLMFSAGMGINIKDLKNSGKAAFIIALLGVVVPLGVGFSIAAAFNGGFTDINTNIVLQNVFIGVILTATSVSITVETLKEMGKLNTRIGTAIISAALIDDVLGIIALTMVISSANPEQKIGLSVVILKILAFFILAGVAGYIFYYFFNKYTHEQKERRRYVLISFAFCLVLAYIAERFFNVADITGAFIAGVVLSNNNQVHYINRRFEILSYILISPIFFANIGLSIERTHMDATLLLFAGCLLLAAILTKMLGCWLGAILSNFSKKDGLIIGIGMVARGEVALIITNKGVSQGIIPASYFGPIIIMVVFTAIITPILLKAAYTNKKNLEYN